MEETVRDKIYDISEERVEETPLAFKRRLYGENASASPAAGLTRGGG